MKTRTFEMMSVLMVIGIASPVFADIPKDVKKTDSTTIEVCTNDDCKANHRLSRSAMTVEELMAELAKRGIKPVADTPAATATTEASKKDKDEPTISDEEYDTLACKHLDPPADEDERKLSASYRRAKCLAGNLEEIKEKMDDAPRGKMRTKLISLYSRAASLIKGQLAESYDVADVKDEALAKQRFNDLADAITDTDDSRWKRDNKLLQDGLDQEFKKRVQATALQDLYERKYAPDIDVAGQQLDYANLMCDARQQPNDYLSQCDPSIKLRAQAQYNALMADSQKLLRSMQQYDPSRDLTRLSRLADGNSLSFFDTYYKESYDSIMNSLTSLGMNNIDRGLNNYGRIGSNTGTISGDIRESRNPGFSLITTMPTYGSFYNNSVIGTNGNTSASDFLRNNPDITSRLRGG